MEISKATPQRYQKSVSHSGTRKPSGPSLHASADFNIKVCGFAGEECVEARRAPRGIERRDVINLWYRRHVARDAHVPVSPSHFSACCPCSSFFEQAGYSKTRKIPLSEGRCILKTAPNLRGDQPTPIHQGSGFVCAHERVCTTHPLPGSTATGVL